MSIVINGMEMPISCPHCPCSDDESRFCRAANKYIPMLGKPEFCPLVTIEERKKGKWNVYYHGETDFSYSCNQCGYSAPYGQYGGEYSQKKWRYCPNCGARMER